MNISNINLPIIKKSSRSLFAILFIFTAQGCWLIDDRLEHLAEQSGEKLGDREVGDIYLKTFLQAYDASTVQVQVRLTDSEFLGEHYLLNDGDLLVVCVGSDCREMQIEHHHIILPEKYTAELPYWEGEEYVVTLYRSGVENAYESYVTLPENFELSAQEPGTTYTDGDMLSMSWSPVSSKEDVVLTPLVKCKFEDGSGSINPGLIMRDTDKDGYVESSIEEQLGSTIKNEPYPPLACSIDIEMTYSNEGHVDPMFKGGYIHGNVTRKFRGKYSPS